MKKIKRKIQMLLLLLVLFATPLYLSSNYTFSIGETASSGSKENNTAHTEASSDSTKVPNSSSAAPSSSSSSSPAAALSGSSQTKTEPKEDGDLWEFEAYQEDQETTNSSESLQSQEPQKQNNYTESSSSSKEESSSEPSSEVISSEEPLPQISQSITENPKDNTNLVMGLIAWGFVGVGVIIVIIVLLSSKGSGKKIGPTGKKRYKNKKGKNHLLPDKYYRNIRKK